MCLLYRAGAGVFNILKLAHIAKKKKKKKKKKKNRQSKVVNLRTWSHDLDRTYWRAGVYISNISLVISVQNLNSLFLSSTEIIKGVTLQINVTLKLLLKNASLFYHLVSFFSTTVPHLIWHSWLKKTGLPPTAVSGKDDWPPKKLPRSHPANYMRRWHHTHTHTHSLTGVCLSSRARLCSKINCHVCLQVPFVITQYSSNADNTNLCPSACI